MANEDTFQRCAGTETHRNKVAAVPRALATELEKAQAKAKERASVEHLKHACAVERKDTRMQIANSGLQRARTAERLVT